MKSCLKNCAVTAESTIVPVRITSLKLVLRSKIISAPVFSSAIAYVAFTISLTITLKSAVFCVPLLKSSIKDFCPNPSSIRLNSGWNNTISITGSTSMTSFRTKETVEKINLDFENCDGIEIFQEEIKEMQLNFEKELEWSSSSFTRKLSNGFIRLKFNRDFAELHRRIRSIRLRNESRN